MTPERKMLEAAARAAGYTLWWKECHCKGGMVEAPFIGDRPWRPAEDDGDALRLAVKLGILVLTARGFAVANATDSGGTCERLLSDPDPYAATRLAVLRAAAAIGERMQGG